LQIHKFILILSLVIIAGCAGNKSATAPDTEYVEIDNPALTMTPNAPATIWVPKRYVETGVPRGSELVNKGIEAAKGALGGSQPQQATQLPAAVAQVPASASAITVKNRIAVLELGKNGLLAPCTEAMKKASVGIMLDSSQTAFLARYAAITTPAERGAFSLRLQEDYGANLMVFVSAQEGVGPGKMLKAEIYDAMGGELVRTLDSELPQYPANDPAAKETAVASTLLKLAGQMREVVALLPWYGKVVAVEGDRVYVNAGKEADLRVGQWLKVYRGGKVMKGLGFAPGNRIGTIQISGFVGANGAYGIVREGSGILVSDIVSAE
jgi:hypothetical protein